VAGQPDVFDRPDHLRKQEGRGIQELGPQRHARVALGTVGMAGTVKLAEPRQKPGLTASGRDRCATSDRRVGPMAARRGGMVDRLMT
jgi:hypothetical protein